jgi:O-antigen/teichoic acid export membrane protein
VLADPMVGALGTGIIVQAVTALWVAKERFFSASMIELGRAGIVNVGSALVAWFGHDLLWFAISRVLLDGLFAAAVLYHAERKLSLWRAFEDGRFERHATTFGVRMFWANCAVMGRTEGISLLLASSLGMEPLAVFRIAYSNVYARVQGQLSGLTDLAYARNVKETSHISTRQRFRQYLYLAAVGCLASLGTGAVALPYIWYFLPLVYRPAVYCCGILIMALPLDIVYSYVNQLFLVKYDHRSLTVLLTAHLLIQLLTLALLTGRFGVYGAAASIPVSLILALTLGIVMERKRRPLVDGPV